jgi:hypothetical protein
MPPGSALNHATKRCIKGSCLTTPPVQGCLKLWNPTTTLGPPVNRPVGDSRDTGVPGPGWHDQLTLAGHALGILICGCSLLYKRDLWASKSAGAHSTKSLKISGCKRWCPKNLRVHAPVLMYSLPISTREAGYAHYIKTDPPDFKTFLGPYCLLLLCGIEARSAPKILPWLHQVDFILWPTQLQ